MQVIEHPSLEHPKSHHYLWRYIKPKWKNSFLNGELYFPQLIEFDDYYEAITPLHLFLLSYYKRVRSMELQSTTNESGPPLRSYIDKFRLLLNHSILLDQLKQLTRVSDKQNLELILKDAIDKFPEILKLHDENQRKFYASCWFLGGLEESALMWNSYSQKGGIAVKIKYDRFIETIHSYFSSLVRYNKDHEIKEVTTGLLKYHPYPFADGWLESLDKGVPLPFFKHASYRSEREFRVLIERNPDIDSTQFDNLHKPFIVSSNFHIILHPSSTFDDLEKLRERIKNSRSINIHLSDLSYKVMG